MYYGGGGGSGGEGGGVEHINFAYFEMKTPREKI